MLTRSISKYLSFPDGKSSSKDGFSGPVCKLLSKVNDMKRNFNFEPIPPLEAVIEIPDEVVQNMSTDASLCYQLLQAIHSGILTKELGNRLCGTICHSRWVTTGQALMMLWMSEHGLTGELVGRLKVIVTFVCQVYFPMFFEIKVANIFFNN